MFRDCLANRTYFGNAIIDNNVQTVSKRLRNIKHSYPQLVGTLHKAKFTLDVEAQNMGVYDDQNVRIFERDFLRKHVQDGVINPGYIELVLELKYDGVSIEAEVTDRVLEARSRGDTEADVASDMTPILEGYLFPQMYGNELSKPIGMKFEAIVNYLNLPYETVMNMPIYVRKFWIQKHNKMAEEREQSTNSGNGKTITGEALNDFAAIEQGQS